jgi:hypothetical protein
LTFLFLNFSYAPIGSNHLLGLSAGAKLETAVLTGLDLAIAGFLIFGVSLLMTGISATVIYSVLSLMLLLSRI